MNMSFGLGALSDDERRYLVRLLKKSGNPGCPALRSLILLTAMATAAHAVEQADLSGWISFLILYLPVLALFGYFRKRGVFKARLMLKLAERCGLMESEGNLAGGELRAPRDGEERCP